MKSEFQTLPSQSSVRARGWAVRMGVIAVGAACCLGALAPASASAASVSQLTYLQLLVQLTGDSSQLPEGSKASDYVKWARDKGMVIDWNTKAKLSSDQLAKSLVLLFRLNSTKYGGDQYRILEREGIVVPRGASVSSETLSALINDPTIQLKTRQLAESTTSPNKPGNGIGFGFGLVNNPNGIPPGRPGFVNPANPPRTGNPHLSP